MKLVLITNPETRRCRMLLEACEQHWHSELQVLPYEELLQTEQRLCDLLPSGGRDCLVRLCSPGGNGAFIRELTARGAEEPDDLPTLRMSEAQVRLANVERGQIFLPRQRFLGYKAFLRRLCEGFTGTYANHPDDILLMSDKCDSHDYFTSQGIPMARQLNPITSYASLRMAMEEYQCQRVFIKLRNGSAASGVVAYSIDATGRELAITSASMTAGEPFPVLRNSLRLRRYETSQEIELLVNALCALGGIHVEAWLPKARWEGRPYDFRVVVIDGQPHHRVMRIGRAPMTNLHLGNQRGDLEQVRQADPTRYEHLHFVWQLAENTGATLPRSICIGLDILQQENDTTCQLIEANPFGDLLPNLLWDGQDTYTTQITLLHRMYA